MKTWEVIKELTENPSKKFKEKTLGQVEIYEGILVWSSNMEDVVITDTLLRLEWEEIKEPVSFMEAVESGKRIKIEHSYLDGSLDYLTTNYNELGDVLDEISTYLSDGDIRKILLNGKFYIEG